MLAFLNEVAQHDYIEYFQGFGKFCENGLLRDLSVKKEAALEKDEELIEHRKRVQQLEDKGASLNDIKEIRNKARSYHKSLLIARIWEYQTWCVQDRRDWKIRMGRKEQADDSTPTELIKVLSVIIAEQSCFTEMMISAKVISKQKRKQAIIDLYSFITRDYIILYCPGKEPINGAYHIEGYGTKMER
ncbi:MAG: hypothetical protein M1840_002415 [Geoglossum simile]|nr:MAG: hypothetical protein M1840_002415 [Geoglossum simile]